MCMYNIQAVQCVTQIVMVKASDCCLKKEQVAKYVGLVMAKTQATYVYIVVSLPEDDLELIILSLCVCTCACDLQHT